jgi:rubrerythrin
MATKENVMEAFAGESQANRKYANFADKASDEGFKNIAKVFRAASEAEAFHAKRLLKVEGVVGSTADNLSASVKGETHEFTEMYPAFIKEAETEKKSDAILAFTYAMKAEQVHAGIYSEALAAVQSKRDLPDRKVLVCTVCGNIVFDKAPDKCPICGVFPKMYKEVV